MHQLLQVFTIPINGSTIHRNRIPPSHRSDHTWPKVSMLWWCIVYEIVFIKIMMDCSKCTWRVVHGSVVKQFNIPWQYQMYCSYWIDNYLCWSQLYMYVTWWLFVLHKEIGKHWVILNIHLCLCAVLYDWSNSMPI